MSSVIVSFVLACFEVILGTLSWSKLFTYMLRLVQLSSSRGIGVINVNFAGFRSSSTPVELCLLGIDGALVRNAPNVSNTAHLRLD